MTRTKKALARTKATRPRPASSTVVRDQAIATGSALAATAVVAALAGVPVATALATSLLGGGLSLALRKGLEWKTAGIERWWELVCGQDRDTFEREVEAHATDPAMQETILRSLRAQLELPAPEATPALAELSRWYLQERRKPDAFFRSAIRLLTEVSADELAELTEVCTWTADRLSTARGFLHFWEPSDRVPHQPCIRLDLSSHRGSRRMTLEDLPWAGNPERIFRVLDAAGFGRLNSSSVDPTIEVERESVRALLRILRPRHRVREPPLADEDD